MTAPVAAGNRSARSASVAFRKRPAFLVSATLTVLAVGVAALLRGGVARGVPAGLPDAGPLTAWGLPASRFAADGAAAATVGFLVAAVILLPRTAPDAAGRARRVAAGCAASWALAASLEFLFTYSDILGLPLPQTLSRSLIHAAATFPQEQALVAQVALALTACGLVLRVPRTAVVPAGCALLLPLATGHSGTASHALAVPALVVHVAAATVWAGGLLALAWIARRVPEHLPPAAERFSGLALGCFLMTAVSGAMNALLRLHTSADLVTSAYGQLTAAKTVLLVLLGLCGARHRKAVLPRIRTVGGTDAFRRLAGAELIIIATTFAVAIALARTAPPGTAGF